MHNLGIDKQLEVIKRGASQIITEKELKAKLEISLKEKRPLRIKAGFDPTAPDIHLGHTVLLRKLRQFQELGHHVIFLIGDFTARIGDPTGRSVARKVLNLEQVSQNAATYTRQISKILDLDKLEIKFNGSWFDKMQLAEFLGITMNTTVQQIIQREDFKERTSAGQEISMLEFIYPILQGYDSVMLQADIELGGTDQIFNLLVGRDMQRDFGQPEQVVITMPLLEGTDGIQKMSKSYGNYIAINDTPVDMFGKIMSISDEMMFKYYTLLTDADLESVKKMHPKQAKLGLAEDIASQYHGVEAAKKAKEEFEQVFSKGELPQDIPVYKLKKQKSSIIEVLLDSGLTASKNEARRLIQQGGVSLDGEQMAKEDQIIDKEGILRIGKRRFLKLTK